MAEWWNCEDGGIICSNCGHFHDDYFDTEMLWKCPECEEDMIENNKMEVDRYYRLSKGIYYVDEKEYPSWLLKLRLKEKFCTDKQNNLRHCEDYHVRECEVDEK